HYHLASPASTLTLEILDAAGTLVRTYTKGVNPDPDPRAEGHWPDWWIRPSPVLSAEPGLHRFVWDLRYPRPKALSFSFPISAIPGQTVPEPLGPLVAPGRYTVRLTVDGQVMTQSFTVRADPRVTTSVLDLRAQSALSWRLWDGINRASDGLAAARSRNQPTQPWTQLMQRLTQLMQTVDDADRLPTKAVRDASLKLLADLDRMLAGR
ncbi:MAG: hypothetical protein JNL26_14690, partial [Gemmatimonadetes bacterium]|nr:hypothetical protein [Gemmatimonadota bacterium]